MPAKSEKEQKRSISLPLQIFICLLAVLLFGIAVEGLFLYRVRKQPAEQQGLVYLDPSEITASGGMKQTEQGFEKEDGAAGELTFTLGGRYVEKLRYDFEVLGIYNARVIVDKVNLYGNPERVVIDDKNSACITSSFVPIRAIVSAPCTEYHFSSYQNLKEGSVIFAIIAHQLSALNLSDNPK